MSINHFKFTCQLENWPTRDLISSSAKSMVLLLLERSTHHSVIVENKKISHQIHDILRLLHKFKQNYQNMRS